ncbi:hypothetical protein [Bacillus chungangensis]|uniref:Uncharacterized protein n=1 Tax=Bacillus chungangensis TaxID=587633 RepID=A0ABT9WND8_9BACI|nr:hypothetical protein [Bacillus chungangensis]MDQ0174663.1 hypothetical protein [Bacillus chungangensis]
MKKTNQSKHYEKQGNGNDMLDAASSSTLQKAEAKKIEKMKISSRGGA